MSRCSLHYPLLVVVSLFLVSTQAELELILDKFHKILEPKDIVQTDLNFDNSNNKVLINGEVKQLIDVNNDWMVNITIMRSDDQQGDYNKMMALPVKGVCDVMVTYYKTYFYETLKNYANAPEPDNCPVTAETYVIKNYPLDSSKFRKFLKPGYYRIHANVLLAGEEKLNYMVEAHVDSK